MPDIFNKKSLAAAQARIKELEARVDGIQFTKDECSSIAFYIDKDFKVRVESKANRDMGNKLVEEGYLSDHQVEDPEAHHLAYLLIANEITDQMISQYQGEPIDKKELEEELDDYNGA